MTDSALGKLPFRIAFKDMDPSPAIEARARQQAAKLARFHPRLMDCQVAIAAPHRRRHKGKLYTVAIPMTVPSSNNLWINRSPSTDHRHAVLDDAFGRLAVGSEARFVATANESEKGLQATTVRLVGKHHLVEP